MHFRDNKRKYTQSWVRKASTRVLYPLNECIIDSYIAEKSIASGCEEQNDEDGTSWESSDNECEEMVMTMYSKV